MTTTTTTWKRKGRVIGRSQIVTPDGDLATSLQAIKDTGAEARRQAKADFDKRHTGRKAFRRKKPSA